MYEIQCPYAPEENEVTMDVDRAMSICLDLAEEFGYACVRDAFGNMYGDYGDVIQAVEDGVIWPLFFLSRRQAADSLCQLAKWYDFVS